MSTVKKSKRLTVAAEIVMDSLKIFKQACDNADMEAFSMAPMLLAATAYQMSNLAHKETTALLALLMSRPDAKHNVVDDSFNAAFAAAAEDFVRAAAETIEALAAAGQKPPKYDA